MLDYNLVGYPLTKQFAACGYEEIEYSHYTGSLIYRPLRLRDNISVWQH
jgi:NADH:ubiquinone oxidoreductase subunit C